MSAYAVLMLFPLLMAFAAASDLITMTIPNRVSLALIAIFFVVAFAAGLSPAEIGWHCLSGAMVLVVTFGLFALGVIGGGDAKLAASTALWMGFSHLLDYVLISALLGGGLTLLMLTLRNYPWPGLVARFPWIARLYRLDKGVPYGIALGFAGLAVYPSTDLFLRTIG